MRIRGAANKRVLFVIGSMDVGGAEKQLVLLADRLRDHGYASLIFSLQGDGRLTDVLKRKSILFRGGGLKRGELRKAPWKLLQAAWRLSRAIHLYKPEVLHAFLPVATFMGAVAGQAGRVSLIVTSRRALANHQERVPLLRPLDRMADRLSHLVTVNSRAVWEDAVRRNQINPKKLALIYNGVDCSQYELARLSRAAKRNELGLSPGERAVVVVANLIAYKGHDDLLSATAIACKSFPELVLLVVGEDRGIGCSLESHVSKLGIRDSVKFLGQRKDVPELLAASDVSVLPSLEEGFSNVILESMAAGLPVVATDVGGNREAVVNGETGWLVPPGDPEALAAKIVDLLRDSSKASQWGERGRRRVRELFSVERMIEEHVKMYDSALCNGSREL